MSTIICCNLRKVIAISVGISLILLCDLPLQNAVCQTTSKDTTPQDEILPSQRVTASSTDLKDIELAVHTGELTFSIENQDYSYKPQYIDGESPVIAACVVLHELRAARSLSFQAHSGKGDGMQTAKVREGSALYISDLVLKY